MEEKSKVYFIVCAPNLPHAPLIPQKRLTLVVGPRSRGDKPNPCQMP
jgi:hypothetical protein